MADSIRYKDWYEKAKKDLQSSQILFKHDGDYAIIAFHCQQAIEKILKGYILKHTGNLTEGHSLVYLCKTASVIENDHDLKKYLKDCAFVNQFYIETRYPSEIFIELDKDEIIECISIAEEILSTLVEIDK